MCNFNNSDCPYREYCCNCPYTPTVVQAIPRYIAGPVGPQGEQGIQGEQGPQGEPGVVTPATAVADIVVTEATVTSNAEKINELLAALRTAGLLET